MALGLGLFALGSALQAGFQPGLDLRVFGGVQYDGGMDLQTDFGLPVDPSLASYFGLGVDYGWSGGFVAGLDLARGPLRRHTFGGPAYGVSGVIAVENSCAFLTPGWRAKLMKNMVAEARLGLGLIGVAETVQANGYPTSSYSGIGFGVWPELRAEYEIGPWGLGLGAGYLASLVQSLADSNGQILQNINAANATLRTEGFTFNLFGVYHFTPLFQ